MAPETLTARPILYKLRIGVTGHRELLDIPATRYVVDDLLRTINRALQSATALPSGPHSPQRTLWERLDRGLARALFAAIPMLSSKTREVPPERQTPLQWTIVSPLAKGADRIVARAALELLDAQLEVITPFSLEHYKRDFEDADDLAEFEELYRRSTKQQHLKGDEAKSNSEAVGASDQHVGYLSVGLRVIESCELLIAVWDGRPPNPKSVGSTAHIVELAKARGRRVLWVNATDPNAPVKMWDGNDWVDLRTDAKTLSLGFHRLSAYNRDPAQQATVEQASAEKFSKEILESASEARLDLNTIEPLITAIKTPYARADHLAGHNQKMYRRSAGLLHALPALAVVAVVVQQLFFSSSIVLIAVEAGLMVLALVLLRVSAAEAWHEKWLNDRHLAERFRTKAFVWIFEQAGTEDHPNTLPFYRGPESWLEQAVRMIIKPVDRPELQPDQLDALKHFVLEGWVRNQSHWHARNAQKRSRHERRLRQLNLALFVLTLGAATAHLLGIGHLPDGTSSALGRTLTMVAIAAPAIAASLYGYRELLDLGRIAERSAMMSQVLDRYAVRVEEARDLDQLREEVRRVEEITASENLEWLSSLGFRELNLVT